MTDRTRRILDGQAAQNAATAPAQGWSPDKGMENRVCQTDRREENFLKGWQQVVNQCGSRGTATYMRIYYSGGLQSGQVYFLRRQRMVWVEAIHGWFRYDGT